MYMMYIWAIIVIVQKYLKNPSILFRLVMYDVLNIVIFHICKQYYIALTN